MTHGLPAYPDYKDSGLPWLGAFPAHWDTRRNGRLFAQRNETGFGGLPILEVSLHTGVRVRDMDNGQRKQLMSDREKYKRAVQGDIAYNMMRMWQGAIGVVPADGLVSPAYVVARPYPDTDPRYFAYLYRTTAYRSEIDAFSRGIVKDRNRLYWEDFKRMPTCVPAPDEQRAISDYLDANAAIVRRFIRNRRRLIEVLTEQKQAIITRAVTKGLNPGATKLKESASEWLGLVPACWKLSRFKRCVRFANGQVDPRVGPYRDMILIAPEHLEKHTGKIIKMTSAADQGAISGKYIAEEGQVIYSKIRPALRKATVAPCRCLCSADMYPLSPVSEELRTEYLLLILLSDPFTRYVVDCSMRVAMPKVNRDALGACWLCYPSLSEQDKILAFIAENTAPLNATISRIEREIHLIQEYRTRLIADVVTGKVDVRGFLPTGTASPDEPIDDAIEERELDYAESELVEEAVDAAD